MTEQEKYLEGYMNCGIKVGDRVRVTRKAEDFEEGWGNCWIEDMDDYVGKDILVVGDHKTQGFYCEEETSESNLSWGFPYFVLEKI